MRQVCVYFLVMLVFCTSLPITAFTKSSPTAYVVIERTTGQIIEQANEEVPLGVAQLIKLLVVYMAFEAVEQGDKRWEDELEVSVNATRFNEKEVPIAGLQPGEFFSFSDLVKAVLLTNATDATAVIAESLAKDEEAFLQAMRKKAKQLGMGTGKIINSYGINNEQLGNQYPADTGFSDETVATASSIAQLAYALTTQYPEVLTWQQQTTHTMVSENREIVLENQAASLLTTGVESAFIGTTDFAGVTLVATVQQNSIPLLVVALQMPGTEEQLGSFFQSFMNEHFATLLEKEVYPAGYIVPEKLAIQGGEITEGSLMVQQPLRVFTTEKEEEFTVQPLIQSAYEKGMKAPVSQGVSVGTVQLYKQNDPIRYIAQEEAHQPLLVTAQAVQASNRFSLFFRGVWQFIKEYWQRSTTLFTSANETN